MKIKIVEKRLESLNLKLISIIDEQKSLIEVKCELCGEIEVASYINIRNRSHPCKICYNKLNRYKRNIKEGKTVTGKYPHLKKYFINKDDSDFLATNSSKITMVKCDMCGYVCEKSISALCHSGMICTCCSEKVSFNERVLSRIFLALDIPFIREYKNPHDSSLFKYDFYLPTYNAIIELHGAQHYRSNTQFRSTNDKIDTMERDKIKKSLVIQDVDVYIEVDMLDFNYEYMYDKLVCNLPFNISEKITPNIFNKSFVLSLSDKHKRIVELYNKGDMLTRDIAFATNLKDPNSVTKVIAACEKSGICKLRTNKKKVYQYTKDLMLVNIYESCHEAGRETGVDFRNISTCCTMNRKTFGGFIWSYKELGKEVLNG